MSIDLTLRPDIFAATVDEHLVLLDAASGSYLCRASNGAVLQADGCTLSGCDPSLCGELTAASLAESPPGAARPRRRAPTPRATALKATYPPPRIADAWPCALVLRDLLAHYAGRSFADILASADGTPRHRVRRAVPLGEALDSFQSWIPYAPISGKCLIRSFVLLRHLRRQGLDAMWVFGVTTWPFEAHCWLQADDLVLDDELDRVAPYTPIMVR